MAQHLLAQRPPHFFAARWPGRAERHQKPRPVPPPQTPDETLACLPGAPSPSVSQQIYAREVRFGLRSSRHGVSFPSKSLGFVAV
ncbi:hypothetical protein ZWY2020_017937 [Hordeum vulgare]|nr:hypothetical protein ZWY2020_017937 [Hordeum vulgare]